MEKEKIVSIEERIPKLKKLRKRKTNRRLIFIISLFFLLVLAIVYFQSSLSKVQSIDVEGNELTSKADIIAQSGIEKGGSVWKMGLKQVEKKLERDPKIQQADVSLVFPNKLNISVEEQQKLAYLAKGKKLYPVLNNGTVLNKAADGTPEQLPILYDFKAGKELDQMMDSLEQLPGEIVNSISEIYYAPKKTDRLHIQLFMNDGFEVSATLKTFSEKMIYYPAIVSQLDPDIKGVIDLEVGSYFRAYHSGKKEKSEEPVPEQ
ncbi:FtsQ-type POTRA domain-containing protein [Bacillus aerolatus]|uniref:Cell division protein DivIB n=1 Tax=Bacillus aerolatus TaxID=2653354 RepID=A0A6I1FNE0_9BACI|nr:cell division protein FtsQ/DivIB [Bacillus aerolatus]KAB7707974.1 FtsQ-type POTRA domain-containing protein [Bacillus aerolatus]